jgi:V-type H+-transporting ATPase proteolipid subunit
MTVVRFDRFVVTPSKGYPLAAGFIHLGAGISCGMTGIAAGYAIGLVGDSVGILSFYECMREPYYWLQCVRAYVHEQRVFVSMILILIFAEVLGLYG